MEEDRIRAMADRLELTALRTGVSWPGVELLVTCFLDQAMPVRAELLRDSRHPEMLHPARTALILLDDVGETDPAVLIAAMLFDSERPELSAAPESLEGSIGQAAVAILNGLPSSRLDSAVLLERLVTVEAAVLNGAVAERLDHARHLHLGSRERWVPFFAQVQAVYLPVAARAHPRLEQRLRAWSQAFARRLERAGQRL